MTTNRRTVRVAVNADAVAAQDDMELAAELPHGRGTGVQVCEKLQTRRFSMRIRSWSSCALLVAAITACGSRQQSTVPATSAPAPAQTTQQPGGGAMCPMMMTAGTQVATSDTSDGVAIAFTTTGDVADLRARVRRMADMHNQMAGAKGKGMQGGGMQGGGKGMRMVPSRASVEDVPGGARLVLVPTDPSQLGALRQQARMHAEMMQQGRCPMMAPPAPGPEPGAEHEQHHPGGA